MCGGCGGGHVFTICMFSLTAEYKRTNSYDECITMKMQGI